MKKLTLILAMLAVTAWGYPHRVAGKITGTGGAPIPTAFSSSDAKSYVQALDHGVAEICITNETASRIMVNVEDGSPASAPASADFYVSPSLSFCTQGPFGSAIYFASDTGATITALSVTWTITYK